MQKAGKIGGKGKEKFPDPSKGQTRDKVAEKTNLGSGKTFEKAKKVWDKAKIGKKGGYHMSDKVRYKFNGKPVRYKCPLCGDWVPLKVDKNNKPHGYCWTCGFQFFFRQPKGIQLIRKGLKTGIKDLQLEEGSKNE